MQYKATGGQKTLQELGFHYVNMDASWDLPNRSAATGELQPDDPTKRDLAEPLDLFPLFAAARAGHEGLPRSAYARSAHTRIG